MDLGDVLNQFFGGGGMGGSTFGASRRSSRRNTSNRGKDLQMKVSVSMKDLYS